MKVEKIKTYNNLTLEEVKQQLRIDNNLDDTLLNSLIKIAVQIAEDYTNTDIALTTATLTENYEDSMNIDSYIIYEPNFIELSGVTGSTTINVNTIYHHEDYVKLEFDKSYDVESISIQYKSGYNENEMPLPIKQAIILKIGELYDVDRNGYVISNIKKTNAFELLLNRYIRMI